VWQDQLVSGRGSVGRAAVSLSISAGVVLTLLSLGVSWLVHRRRRRRAASAAAAATEAAADNDGRDDANSTDNAAFPSAYASTAGKHQQTTRCCIKMDPFFFLW